VGWGDAEFEPGTAALQSELSHPPILHLYPFSPNYALASADLFGMRGVEEPPGMTQSRLSQPPMTPPQCRSTDARQSTHCPQFWISQDPLKTAYWIPDPASKSGTGSSYLRFIFFTFIHSVADPDPVPFLPLDPGSGIGFFRIPDPTIISESLKPIFSWVKKLK
jgi:hypothetical protein